MSTTDELLRTLADLKGETIEMDGDYRVPSYGSAAPDATVQVITKAGFVGGPMVVQVVTEAQHQDWMPSGTSVLWLSPSAARTIAGALARAADDAEGCGP